MLPNRRFRFIGTGPELAEYQQDIGAWPHADLHPMEYGPWLAIFSFRCAVEGPYVPGAGMQFKEQRPEASLTSRQGDVC